MTAYSAIWQLLLIVFRLMTSNDADFEGNMLFYMSLQNGVTAHAIPAPSMIEEACLSVRSYPRGVCDLSIHIVVKSASFSLCI